MNNCFQTSKKILELLEVRFTGNYLKEEILTHPQFPSLLTISDVLEKYHISTLALKIGKEKLDQIPTPCIVQVQVKGNEYFQTLFHITEDSFSGYDETGKPFNVSREVFFFHGQGWFWQSKRTITLPSRGLKKAFGKKKSRPF